MIALNLPDDVLAKVTAEAERRGVAVDAMLETAVREWVDDHAQQAAAAERDRVLAALEAKGVIYRVPAPAERVAWQPFDWPGVLLSETIIEGRGER